MPEIAPNRHDSLPHAEQQVRRAYDRIFKKMLPKVVELGMTTEEAGFVIPQADARDCV